MKNLSLKNITKKSAIVATVITGLSAGTAFADTFNAALSIVEPIALTQTTQMNLGAILATTSNTCTIAALGDLTGTGCFDDSATGTLAAIGVDGTTGLQVDIALTAGASAASELSFIPSLLDNGQGATTLTGVTLQASHSLSLGGALTIDNGPLAITNNVTSVDYQVDVTYQ